MTLDSGFLKGLRALTFDCYGTLIDWDGGVELAARALTGCAGCHFETLVRDREDEEKRIEAGDYLPYGEVLARSLKDAAKKQGREVSDAECEGFARSMESWKPFPDSHDALRALSERFQLGILSNVETRVLEKSIAALDARIDVRVTAEQVRSYKPKHAHFEEGLRRLELPKESVLHVAGSLFHDIEPAKSLGWTTAWIDRRGEGLPADGPQPDVVLPDMKSLAQLLL